jgi:hypothetical protein
MAIDEVLEMARRAKHGTRTMYVRGCTAGADGKACDACKEANRLYGQDLKERKRTGKMVQKPLASVTKIRVEQPEDSDDSDQPAEPGRVETAVASEISKMSARTKHPGLVASCLAMASIIDKPALVTTHPSAQRQLSHTLDKLWAASVGRTGKLADISQMSRRTVKAADKAAGGE